MPDFKGNLKIEGTGIVVFRNDVFDVSKNVIVTFFEYISNIFGGYVKMAMIDQNGRGRELRCWTYVLLCSI